MSAVPTSTALAVAPRMTRGAAFVIDVLILAFAERLGATLGGILGAVILTLREAPPEAINQAIETGITFGAAFWGLAVLFVNYGVLQGYWGGSAGKLICGLRIVNRDGTAIGPLKSILRTFAYLVSIVPFYLGFAIALLDRRARTLHDHLCGTFVTEHKPEASASATRPVPLPIPLRPLRSEPVADVQSKRAA